MKKLCILILVLVAAGGRENTHVKLEKVVSGLTEPVYVTNDGVNPQFLYIVERKGLVRRLDLDSGQLTEWLDIKDKVMATNRPGDELGLLCMGFHPKFKDNGRLFLYYSAVVDSRLYTVLEEYRSGEDGVVPHQTMLQIRQPFPNHNGGQIMFGDEGYLYLSTGDGGGTGDSLNNSQNLKSYLGKILRINVDNDGEERPYSAPADNPFVTDGEEAFPEIWAYGFRNPWRCSIDPVTKIMICGDVGQWKHEEITPVIKGGNHGWNLYEGLERFRKTEKEIEHVRPFHTYTERVMPGGASVTGGYVYRGKKIKGLYGSYIYGDWSSKKIFALEFDPQTLEKKSNKLLLKAPEHIASFGLDYYGEIYVVGYGEDFRRERKKCSVYKIAPSGNGTD